MKETGPNKQGGRWGGGRQKRSNGTDGLRARGCTRGKGGKGGDMQRGTEYLQTVDGRAAKGSKCARGWKGKGKCVCRGSPESKLGRGC